MEHDFFLLHYVFNEVLSPESGWDGICDCDERSMAIAGWFNLRWKIVAVDIVICDDNGSM